MRNKGKKKSFRNAIVTTSWDDGHPLDLKLAELLLKFGIRGTFYVSPRNQEHTVMSKAEIRQLSKSFDIGSHTMTHPDLRRLNDIDLNKEIRGSKIELESTIGAPVNMFCYPRGKHNQRVRNAVADAGFLGARTMREFSLKPGQDRLQMATTLLAYPLPIWIRIRHEVRSFNWRGLSILCREGIYKSWVELACYLFEEALKIGGVWHLWGHSWEIEENGLLYDLEKVIRFVANRRYVEYLSNSDLIRNLK